ncbi:MULTISPECIES: iron ABC transporter permease [unclassified Oceanispirochaeta]|uniref:ABC transporter permease n=1 Tax=unclassified Oceanispirochaeta TaxID=2635722 RepID=UPI000E09AC8F|nr:MULTISPECIES: iron ABC transporter permease [unclassified Oceanispirochaeta]MBF9017060.1 iron ABC transporter permease [Oceanispirochaeta sp. M2]NPD73509.1 iron ABC transporter permease [Oceanispirochaeta sp. M1]RDG30799.1 iron ABC transporter permease [Oceanispirochaeta sp. M1]
MNRFKMMKEGLKRSGEIRLLPVIFFLFLTFYLPVTVLLLKGLQSEGGWTADWLAEIILSPYYRRIFIFTFGQALLSTVLSLILGLPGGWILSHLDFPGKKFLKALTTIPFILPSILVVLGFILFWGRQGVVNSVLMTLTGQDKPVLDILYSFKAILLAHVFYNFPIALRLIAAWWEGLGENQHQAARTLGASEGRIFSTITLPQLLPGMISAGSLIFLYCFMSFAVVLVLGGGPRYSTLEVEVYRLIKYSLDFGKGGALALVETAATLFLTWFYIRREGRNIHRESLIRSKMHWKDLRLRTKLFTAAYFVLILFIIFGPILTVMAQSFLVQTTRTGPVELSLRWYREILAAPGSLRGNNAHLLAQSMRNSLFLGFSTLILTLIIGSYTSWVLARFNFRFSGMVETVIMMPMGVSSVVLGMGYLWLLRGGRLGAVPPVLTIILAHTVIALPFVLRALTPAMKRIRQNLLDASRLMGAGGVRQFLSIELPLVKPGLITGGAFALAISLGEINATLILSDAGIPTIPIAILRLIGTYKFYSACALGTILILICLAAFILIDAFEGWEN